MMILTLAVSLLAADPNARFETDGVRVGDTLVQGATLKKIGAVLASGSCVEPLTRAVEVGFETGTLVLEPGVRAERAGSSLVLATHNRRAIRLLGDGTSVVLPSPVRVNVGQTGWEYAEGHLISGLHLVARQQEDQDLESMKEAARKAEEALKGPKQTPPDIRRETPPSQEGPRSRRKPRLRRIFQDDPLLTTQVADSHVLRWLPAVSPSGF
ncbi:MAG: hypothetical protein HYY16_15800 [Planctomycetes bacterium]|nr:hypothetical protein [Planctomycetota bacterium]